MKTLTEVMFQLVELVEERIAAEMNESNGALLFDGWSSGGVHYTGVHVSYCLKPRYSGSVRALIAVSPIARLCSKG